MVKQKEQPLILTGYRVEGIGLFTTKPHKAVKVILYSAAGISGAIALIPNGLGFIFYPASTKFLTLAGFPVKKVRRIIRNTIRPILHQRGLLFR